MANRKYSKPFNLSSLRRDAEWRQKVIAEQKVRAASVNSRTSVSQCPICDSKEYVRIAEVYAFHYAECSKCGHVFNENPPDNESARALYLRDDPDEKQLNQLLYAQDSIFMARVKEIALPKVKFILDNCDQGPSPIWIDVGAGGGDVVAAALEAGCKPMGLESDLSQVSFALKRGLPFQHALVERANAKKFIGGAQIVSLINILEHLNRPQELLDAVVSGVSEEATIAIEVPRHPSISALANIAFPDDVLRHLCPPDHLHIFSEASLTRMLTDCGLSISAIWAFGQDFLEILMTLAPPTGTDATGSETLLRESLFKNVAQIQSAIDKSGLSDTMLVVCHK